MNKYHNRNRIFSPIMTIHDILTLHILSSFLSSLYSLSLSFLFFFPFSPFLFFFPLSSLSLPLSFILSLPFLLYLPYLPLCFLSLLS